MIEYIFMTIGELARYLEAHPGKEVGFTDDSKEDLKYNREPTEWHGACIVNVFDTSSLVCGYCGAGVDFGHSAFDLEDILDGLVEYFNDYLDMKVTKNTEICLCKDDLKED